MRSITESFGCTVQQDEICKGRTLHRQALRGRGGRQWNNARAPFQRVKDAAAVCSAWPVGLGWADGSPQHEGMDVLGARE